MNIKKYNYFFIPPVCNGMFLIFCLHFWRPPSPFRKLKGASDMTYDVITSNQSIKPQNRNIPFFFAPFRLLHQWGRHKSQVKPEQNLRLSAEYEPEGVDQPVIDTCDGVADEFPKSGENRPERLAGEADAAGRGGRAG